MLHEHAAGGMQTGWGWVPAASCALLFILKVSLAASLDTAEFQKRLTRRWPILFGVACQFVISPACGALIAWLLGVSFVQGVVLLVLTSCPGGCFSNWLCQLVNGDLAMSVAMTGCSTLMGMAMLPTNIYLYTKLLYAREVLTWQQWRGVIASVATVFAALVVGLGIGARLQSWKWRQRFSALGTVCGLLLFALSMLAASGPAAETQPLWRRQPSFYMAVSLPIIMATCIVVVLTSADCARLEPPERVAVVIEAVYQNTALGATMVLQMFPGRHLGDIMGLVVLYQLCQGAVLVIFGVGAHYCNWTLVSPCETSLWAALVGNFQDRAGAGALLRQAARKASFQGYCQGQAERESVAQAKARQQARGSCGGLAAA